MLGIRCVLTGELTFASSVLILKLALVLKAQTEGTFWSLLQDHCKAQSTAPCNCVTIHFGGT